MWHIALLTGSERRTLQRPPFQWVNMVLGNIKAAIITTDHNVKKKPMVSTPAELEWRVNHCKTLLAMIPVLASAEGRTKLTPYWHFTSVDYSA